MKIRPVSHLFMQLQNLSWITFGINSPSDLPKIQEVLNQEIIEATKVEDIQHEFSW